MQEKLAILLSRKLSGEASPEELEELEEWIRSNPQDHYLINVLSSYWKNHTHRDLLNISDDSHFKRILNKAEDLEQIPIISPISADHVFVRRKNRKRWLVAAAVFLGLIMIAALFAPKDFSFGNNEESEIVTSPGAKSHIILPDGSKVWLNAATRLHYDTKFNGALREIYLEGEAYFDVKKDTSRPFIVHTSDIDIRVLGTAFNVKSYKEEPTIEATLVHGSIRVSSKLKQNVPEVLLNPNEKLVFTKKAEKSNTSVDLVTGKKEEKGTLYIVSKVLPAKNDSLFSEIAWVHNRLLFDGETFKELAVKMERWFNVKIEFQSEEVARYRLRGVFEDETIAEALKALQQIADFKYAIKDNVVTISK